MKKTSIFTTIASSVPISTLLEWLLNKLYDHTLTPPLKAALDYFLIIPSYMAGPFGYGLIVGVLIFCIWDLPYIGSYLKRITNKWTNAAEDDELATQCEKISKQLYEHSTNIDRIREDLRWNPCDPTVNVESNWEESKKQQFREHDRFLNKSGHEISALFVKLKNKGIKVELDDIKIIQWRLLETSVLFEDIANSLRSGTYLDGKSFKLDRSEH